MLGAASPVSSLAIESASLGAVLDALEGHDEKDLHIAYGGRMAQSGYHVTEVKAGSFLALDCGANAESWHETVLQVEDIPPKDGESIMKVGKFRSILAKVERKIRLDTDARLTIEIGMPDVPMQVFDVSRIELGEGAVVLQLGPRPAICKPRHRARQSSASQACCGTASRQCC